MMQRQGQAQSAEGKLAPASTHLPRRNGRQYQDVNHLLGFTLPPRAPPAPAGPRRSAKRNPGHGVFDRSRFVHQFRFVVKPDKDYTAHFADPDIHLDWDDILQVILPTSSSALSSVSTGTVMDQPFDKGASVPTCPICLSEPTAPRMTKCGHVFCYPCLLHYLALADGQKWRKCPVCWDSVYAKDLKAVKWHDPVSSDSLADVTPSLFPFGEDLDHSSHDAKLPTESLKMRLIRRPQISTLALPRSSTWPSEAVPPLRAPWQFTPDAFAYAKFMLAPPDYMKTELEANLKELQQEIATLRRWGVGGGTDEELGIVFVQSAMKKVEEQLEKVQALKTATVMTARKKALREIQEIQDAAGRALLGPPLPLVSETETSSSEVEADGEIEGDAPSEFLGARSSALSGAAPAFSPASLASQALKPRPQRRNVNPPLDPESSYYFYQAASGQNIFLHPLDIKILKSHFGTYQGMPDTIEVQVEGADEGRVNEELRRRCRWLSHLPTSADLVFIEADLSKVVSKASLEPYVTPLKQRRTKRRDKARREDKAKAKSEQREQESRPIYTHSAEYSPSSYSVPLPTSIAALTSSFAETHAFPPPSSTALSSSPPSAAAPESTESPSRTIWGTRSFATALHASSSHEYSGGYVDEDFDERWHEFEERVGGGRGGGARGGGSASGSNSGGGRGQDAPPPPKGKKKKGKLTLNLSGAGMRGSG